MIQTICKDRTSVNPYFLKFVLFARVMLYCIIFKRKIDTKINAKTHF